MTVAINSIGYFCSLVPVEIIMAAGLKPVRVKGRAETTAAADAYMYPNMCPYVKSLFADGLDGGKAACDGVVFTRSCDGMRRLYDAWKAYIPSGFVYMLEAPKNCDDLAVDYFSSQLRSFAQQLGKKSGVEVKAGNLVEAVKAQNRVRRMMQELYVMQSKSPLPVKGSELFKLGLEILSGEGRDSAGTLKSVIDKVKKQAAAGQSRRKPRVLVSGNVMDRPGLFDIIEGAGAEVPFADLCTASRYFERTVDENAHDIYGALATAYLGEPRCSRAATPAEIYARLSKKVKEYAIDGVLLTSLKYCDQVLNDMPYLVRNFTAAGTPVLFVENDYLFSDSGRLRTRVEAFIEMLEK
ncbi:MAG: 2-hydroxyacyl-CoA dehydratase family protein [Chloroflexi bacterium]|nr:2-hydroxyacyl-CoA dehydratase family protein [Chloroflexota bacterium]